MRESELGSSGDISGAECELVVFGDILRWDLSFDLWFRRYGLKGSC